MTPYELSIATQSYIDRTKQDYEHQLTCAWINEYLHRTKRLPKLEKLLGKDETPKVMTDSEMLEKVKQLNLAMGGNVIVKEGEVNGNSSESLSQSDSEF